MLEFQRDMQLFQIRKGDITALRADAVVVAREQVKPGEALKTEAAGPLAERFRYVIHTGGPRWEGGFAGEEAILRSCYRQSLELAEELDCRSVVFPLISADFCGFPPEKALELAVSSICEYLRQGRNMRVTLAIWGEAERNLAGVLVPGAQAFPAASDFCMDDIPAENFCPMSQALPNSSDRPRPSFAQKTGRKTARAEAAELFAETAYFPETDRDPALGESLANMILRLGEEAGMSDPEIYKAANLSRAAFHKIISGKTLNPSRQTVAAIAIALKLDHAAAVRLMAAAGLAFADNNAFDVIVESCIRSGFYDLWKINCALADRNLPLLGSISL